MRIRVTQYDAKSDAPVDPGKKSFRARELQLLKVLAVVLAAVTVFGGIFSHVKMQYIRETEGRLKSVECVYSGTKYRTLTALNLLIGDAYYYLDGDYIHNDGERQRIDHLEEMQQMLESDKMMGQPICIQYLQLTRYDRPVIIGAVCRDIPLLDCEYSLQVHRNQLEFDLLLGTAVLFAFLGIYWFRKRYSIKIDKSCR